MCPRELDVVLQLQREVPGAGQPTEADSPGLGGLLVERPCPEAQSRASVKRGVGIAALAGAACSLL